MNLGFKLFVAKNTLMGTLFPAKAAESAKALFLTPRSYPLKNWESEIERSAQRITLSNGLSALRWGQSGPKILLVHGWESRATQMAGFVDKLVDAGYQVIALDAPAHGQSPGKQANPYLFAQAVLQTNAELGPFDAIIGHSMGGSAVAIALAEGVETNKTVLISSPSSIESVLNRFARFIGLPDKSRALFVSMVEQTVGRSAKSLEIASLIQNNSSQGLVIHDEQDLEIPFDDAKAITQKWQGANLLATQGFGHRAILRQDSVWQSIIGFLHRT